MGGASERERERKKGGKRAGRSAIMEKKEEKEKERSKSRVHAIYELFIKRNVYSNKAPSSLIQSYQIVR